MRGRGRGARLDPRPVVGPLARPRGGWALARLAARPGRHPVDRGRPEPGGHGGLRPRGVHVL